MRTKAVNDPGMLRWLWRVLRWPMVGLTAIVAFVLGTIGFADFLAQTGTEASNSDVLYLSLQLFTLESGGAALGDVPWQLRAARILAPASTATALAAALIAVYRYEIDELRLRRQKGHIVVAGLGRRGLSLATQLRARGYRVVGIESDPDHTVTTALRRHRIPLVEGDARDIETLHRARASRASHVIALTGADDTNADIALGAGSMASPERKRPLMCHAHIQDPELCVMLREEELAAGGHPGFRLDFLNIYDQAARSWMEANPPFAPGREPQILIVGLSPLGQSLVIEAARLWRSHSRHDRRPLPITVADTNANAIVGQLRRRFPQLAHTARIHVLDMEPVELTCDQLTPPPTVAHVCLEDDSNALEVALRIRGCLQPDPTPVIVQLSKSLGLAGLLGRSGNMEIRPLSLFDEGMNPDLLLGGTFEILAREIHALYVAEQLAEGVDETTNPSLVPWSQLSDSLQESNRDQSAHIGTKLAAIGCDIAPLVDWDAEDFEFSTAELEMLAELEHERWMAQRHREGWKLGDKDVARNRSPYLVPWAQLSEEVREWDRRAVRHIPSLLAGAGYQIVSRPVGRG